MTESAKLARNIVIKTVNTGTNVVSKGLDYVTDGIKVISDILKEPIIDPEPTKTIKQLLLMTETEHPSHNGINITASPVPPAPTVNIPETSETKVEAESPMPITEFERNVLGVETVSPATAQAREQTTTQAPIAAVPTSAPVPVPALAPTPMTVPAPVQEAKENKQMEGTAPAPASAPVPVPVLEGGAQKKYYDKYRKYKYKYKDLKGKKKKKTV